MNLKTVSDGSLVEEERFRRMSWYDFNFHIDWLRRRKNDNDADLVKF